MCPARLAPHQACVAFGVPVAQRPRARAFSGSQVNTAGTNCIMPSAATYSPALVAWRCLALLGANLRYPPLAWTMRRAILALARSPPCMFILAQQASAQQASAQQAECRSRRCAVIIRHYHSTLAFRWRIARRVAPGEGRSHLHGEAI